MAQGKDARKNAASEARYDTPAQAALLQQQATALAPQTKGVTDVYAIGIAGWTQDVFRHELSGALAATEKALPLAGTVRLVNSRETRNTIPLATRKNLAEAVRAVAGVMDKDEDVLLLFMTSHGQKSGFIPPGREWTFFGDALFNHSLTPRTDFQRAFKNAQGLIAGWEKMDKLKPSHPQGHFGDALTRQLAPLFAAKAGS